MAKTEANKTSFGKIFKEKYPQFWEFSPLWCNTESSEVLNDLTHCFMENWDSHKQAEHLHTHMGQHRSVPTSGCPTWNSNLFSQARKGPLRYIKAPEGGKFTPNLDPQNFSKTNGWKWWAAKPLLWSNTWKNHSFLSHTHLYFTFCAY